MPDPTTKPRSPAHPKTPSEETISSPVQQKDSGTKRSVDHHYPRAFTATFDLWLLAGTMALGAIVGAHADGMMGANGSQTQEGQTTDSVLIEVVESVLQLIRPNPMFWGEH